MKYNKILYPSNAKNLEDLSYFSNWGMLFPNYQPSPGYLTEEEESSSVNNFNDKWNYNINKYGFRGNWKLDAAKNKIAFFGCSVTLGQGVEECFTFPYLIEQTGNHTIECLNFGTTGASIQRIAKIISASVRVIDFDLAVITLPPTSRLSYISITGVLTDLVPNGVTDQKGKSFYDHFTQNDLDMYSLDSIQWIKSELKHKKVLWSSWSPYTYDILHNIIEKEYILPQFPLNDRRARDNQHPGKDCHAMYSNMITERIKLLNWSI